MVEAYNDGARIQGLPKQQMHAVQGDLMVPPEKIPEELKREDLYGFDVIVMSMALHHVEDPQLMTTRLVERLRDGGSILIIDWALSASEEQETHHHHEHGRGHHQEVHSAKHTMSRSGFDKEEMIKVLKQAGCHEADYVFHPELSKLPSEFGGEKQLFFARGKK
jgi:2-polyprenyl-3-methyl-5-hydroxy-6-metoxy-1,4-benzoquinol methylase